MRRAQPPLKINFGGVIGLCRAGMWRRAEKGGNLCGQVHTQKGTVCHTDAMGVGYDNIFYHAPAAWRFVYWRQGPDRDGKSRHERKIRPG